MRVFFTASFGLKLAFFCLLVGLAAGLLLGAQTTDPGSIRAVWPSPVRAHLTALADASEGR